MSGEGSPNGGPEPETNDRDRADPGRQEPNQVEPGRGEALPDEAGRKELGAPDGSEESRPEGPDFGEPLPPGQLYRWAWTLYLILAVGGVVWIGLRLGSIPLSLFFVWEELALDLGLGLGAAALLIGVWALMRRLMPTARELEAELARMLGPLEGSEIVALALLSGLAEEIFFRGAMQGALGWPLATIAFTVLHTGPGKVYRTWTLYAAIAGLVLAGLVVWRETLLPAILAHTLVNGVNLRGLTPKADGSPDD